MSQQQQQQQHNIQSSKLPGKASGDLYKYILDSSLRSTPVLDKCRELTAKGPLPQMQTAPDEGQFLGMLVKILNAKKVVEVGVFTGYSSICIAQALPADGKIIACDVSEEYTSVARGLWKEANLDKKIDLILAPATETLQKMLDNGEAGTVDFAFIDADKGNYGVYYEQLLSLLRPGGVIAIDNVLWSGKVIDPTAQDEDTVAIRNLNAKIRHDDRVDISMLGIADGVTLCYKK